MITNPDNADQILRDLGDQLSAGVENVSQEVDEEAISNSISENTDLTGPEAEEAAQNIVEGIEQANQMAEEASIVSAWSLFGLFIAHILMAIVSSLGGRMGARLTKHSEEEIRRRP